jgi:hypothetical protein
VQRFFRGRAWWSLVAGLVVTACGAEGAPAQRAAPNPTAGAISDSAFAALVARISEPGGYFDTDNLISNESGYLKVVGALERLGIRGGAYVGVGPDQNFSYVAAVRPEIAFLIDIRRDNVLQHLLLKALIERAPTRVEFLAGLHGRPAPSDAASWRTRSIAEIVAWVDSAGTSESLAAALQDEVVLAVSSYGVPLTADDLGTIRRFHGEFIRSGMSLRFSSFGREPRPYYPTYRQLVLETDLEGRPASYLASEEAYATVRQLHLENRIVPVVGDLAGAHAVREIGAVMRELGVELGSFYASNVEFYLWQDGTFSAWAANLATLPAAENAVVIRSYFPNFDATHPSAVPGYYATQTLQPVGALLEGQGRGGFRGYFDLVTRDALDLHEPAGLR